jgi:hypothetical protein
MAKARPSLCHPIAAAPACSETVNVTVADWGLLPVKVTEADWTEQLAVAG